MSNLTLDVLRVWEAHGRGRKPAEVVEATRLSREFVYSYWPDRAVVQRDLEAIYNKPGLSEWQECSIEKLNLRGWSYDDISRFAQCSVPEVQKFLKRKKKQDSNGKYAYHPRRLEHAYQGPRFAYSR